MEELEQAIEHCASKNLLEDLYLPFKPKRRTKGQIAIEAGLEPLAELLWHSEQSAPEKAAAEYINPDNNISDAHAALEGAKSIIIERIAEDATMLETLRQHLHKQAHICSRVAKGKEREGEKYKDYFSHQEKFSQVPSHRALAMLRGKNEGYLQLSLEPDPYQKEGLTVSYCETLLAKHYSVNIDTTSHTNWRADVIHSAWKTKLFTRMETECLSTMKEQADLAAIDVFASNLHDLLMASPAGHKVILGIDPGLRTGSKLAVIDETGKVLTTDTIYPHPPQKQHRYI